jgi:glutamate synthase (NADPH) small chain
METNEVKIKNEEGITEVIEKRGITFEDIKEVIAIAETNGRKLYRTDDENRFLAKNRIGNVNVYAEYSPEGDGFLVHTAYAHRVVILSDD